MTSGQKAFLTPTSPYSPICISVSEHIFCFKKQIKQNTHTNIQQKELNVKKKVTKEEKENKNVIVVNSMYLWKS